MLCVYFVTDFLKKIKKEYKKFGKQIIVLFINEGHDFKLKICTWLPGCLVFLNQKRYNPNCQIKKNNLFIRQINSIQRKCYFLFCFQ